MDEILNRAILILMLAIIAICFFNYSKRNKEEIKTSDLEKNMENTNNNPKAIQRPPLVTLVCFLNFFLILLTIFLGLSVFTNPVMRSTLLSRENFLDNLIATIQLFFFVVGTIGYWKMKKWGVYFYSLGFIIGLKPSSFNILSLFLQLWIIWVGAKYILLNRTLPKTGSNIVP